MDSGRTLQTLAAAAMYRYSQAIVL